MRDVEEVHDCSWYKEEANHPSGISRRQRVYYAVQGGLSDEDEYVEDELGVEINDIHRRLRNSIDNLSKHMHIGEATFDLDDERVTDFVNETFSAIIDFFETIDECRRILVAALWEQIDSFVVDVAISKTILSIDELASHYFIDKIYTDQVDIDKIGSHFIRFVAEGTVECQLQWASNSDLKCGDGATSNQSFPFRCKLSSPVDEPSNIVQRKEHLLWIRVHGGKDTMMNNPPKRCSGQLYLDTDGERVGQMSTALSAALLPTTLILLVVSFIL